MNVIVKLPNEVNEKLLMIPFLTVLEELLREIAHKDPEDDTYQIHLISTKKGIEVLNLIPFTAYYHEIDEEDLKSVFTVHRACKHFTITNKLDCFISTTKGFVDASIGKNLNVKKTIGPELGKNKWVLTHAVKVNEQAHLSDFPKPLLTAIENENFELPNVSCRKLDPVYLDWNENPYYIIDLPLTEEERIDPLWSELFEHLTNKRFVFICSQLKPHLQNDLIQEYIETLPQKNTYKIFKLDSYIDFAKLVSFSLGVATESKDLMTIASYCGALTHFINSGVDLKLIGPKYFRGELKDLKLEPEAFNTILDEVISYIELKTKKEEEEKPEQKSQEDDLSK
ncbi:MAG: hypothetical protein CME62_08280 [Halobacteriovoraceae bacterium]|nr:hypothetical protein [Halobacteriovoraceae bacterium]|tara:strand:+ start:3601 stop:4620 length:1020 start_codon:yes stop_codon:yes gene_type:complete